MTQTEELFRPARKNPPGEWLVTRVLMEPALRRAFGGVYARVAQQALVLRRNPAYPVIFCATHSGWWDGHMAHVLNSGVFRHDAYLMMEDAQLARYGFFRWAGAFGVSRHDARQTLASIKYISAILATRRNAALWMFPQGVMAHPDARPLRLYGGAAHIALRLPQCALVPVALRYDFLAEQAPYALANVGAPVYAHGDREGGTQELTSRLAAALTELADDLHDDLMAHDLSGYRRVLSGRGSVNRNWDRVRRWLGLQRLDRGPG